MNPRPSRPVVSASPVPLRDHCNGVPVAVSEMVGGIYNTVVLGRRQDILLRNQCQPQKVIAITKKPATSGGFLEGGRLGVLGVFFLCPLTHETHTGQTNSKCRNGAGLRDVNRTCRNQVNHRIDCRGARKCQAD